MEQLAQDLVLLRTTRHGPQASDLPQSLAQVGAASTILSQGPGPRAPGTVQVGTRWTPKPVFPALLSLAPRPGACSQFGNSDALIWAAALVVCVCA